MSVKGIKGWVERGVLENEVFSIGTVSGRRVYMTNNPSHGGEYLVLSSSPSVSFDWIKIEPFVKLESVVAHASEST